MSSYIRDSIQHLSFSVWPTSLSMIISRSIHIAVNGNEVKWKLLSHVWLFATPWTVVHGIIQARILEWVAFSFSRGSSQSRDRTQVSRITSGFFTSWATKEAQGSFIMNFFLNHWFVGSEPWIHRTSQMITNSLKCHEDFLYDSYSHFWKILNTLSTREVLWPLVLVSIKSTSQ